MPYRWLEDSGRGRCSCGCQGAERVPEPALWVGRDPATRPEMGGPGGEPRCSQPALQLTEEPAGPSAVQSKRLPLDGWSGPERNLVDGTLHSGEYATRPIKHPETRVGNRQADIDFTFTHPTTVRALLEVLAPAGWSAEERLGHISYMVNDADDMYYWYDSTPIASTPCSRSWMPRRTCPTPWL